MENKGLLFIPDISGFTRFINETEIDHSRLIIQELLELLINANNQNNKQLVSQAYEILQKAPENSSEPTAIEVFSEDSHV